MFGPTAAHADRFGPPWMAQVTADQTVVYTQPDRGAPPVGPLPKSARVVVVGTSRAADGSDWSQIPDGFIPSADLAESLQPWVAAAATNVSVYAKPNTSEGIRRTAKPGDLLRVMGVSHGLDGDTRLWWATTEGYVGLNDLRSPESEWASRWTLPSADEAVNGWWGAMRSAANVRAGPQTDAPIVGQFGGGEMVKVLKEEQGTNVQGSATWYRIDGGRYAGAYVHSSLIRKVDPPQPTMAPPPADTNVGSGPWIVVNRQAHTLTLLKNGGEVAFTTFVSLGRAGLDTPTGDYTTFGKYAAERMSSAANAEADHSYDLPNVPFIEYYKDGGYAIHGTYWHDQFGTDESQGCINLTWADSAWLFRQTGPQVANGQTSAVQSPSNPATPVVILA